MGIGEHLQRDKSKTFEVKLDEEVSLISEYEPLDGSYEQAEQRLQSSKAFAQEHARTQQLRGLVAAHPQLQEQQPVSVAPDQQEQPVQAPPEQSWKERRKEQSALKKEIKAGRKLTQHGNEYTARIAQTQKQIAAKKFDPEAPQPALMQILRQVANPQLTPEMFVGKAFMQHQQQIANHLAAIDRLKTVLLQDARALDRLEIPDPVFVKSVQRGLDMDGPLRSLYRTALGAHGVKRDGNGIKDNMYVEGFKQHLTTQVEALRTTQRRSQEQHQADMETEIDKDIVATEFFIQQSDRFKVSQARQQRPEISWIEEKMPYEDLYLGIEEQRSRMEKNAPAYLEHQQIVDRLFGDYIRSAQAYGRIRQRNVVYDNVAVNMELSGQDGAAMYDITVKKAKQLYADSSLLQDNMELLESAMKGLLEGEMTPAAEITLAKYGYLTPAEKACQEHLHELGHAYSKRMKTADAAMRRLLKERPELKGLNTNSVAVVRSIMFYSENDDEYVQTILKLVKTEEERALPKSTWETYLATKKLIAPTVEMLLNLDIEAYLAMSDAELMEHLTELDTLNARTMYAADSMKLPHPEYGRPYTLRSELVGNRTEEFSCRLFALRGVFEKARSLVLSEMLRHDMDIDDCLQGHAEEQLRNLAEGKKDAQMAYFAQRKLDGERHISTNLNVKKAMETPGTPEFLERAKKMITPPEGRVIPHMAHAANNYQTAQKMVMGQDDSTEGKVIERRMRLKPFCLAGWTKKEAVEKGVLVDGKPLENIGESVFRSVTSYLATKAGQTQTEEQFIQMLRDLSAGDGMEYGVTPEAELQAAREQNMRGLREYKETMRLHYDYMAKKYGTKLETLPIAELVKHYDEIQQDLANEQVYWKMVSKVPSLIDPDNETDRDLVHQAIYYYNMGNTIGGMLIPHIYDHQSEEELHGYIKAMVEMPEEFKADRDYMLANAERLGLNLTGQINHRQTIGERRVVQPTAGGSSN